MTEKSKKLRKRVLQKMPQVAILLESSHEASRGRLRGILKYVRLHGPWGLHIVTGGAGDQRLPTLKNWGATGILGRVPNEKLARTVIAADLPIVLFDPMDRFLMPRHPLSNCCRVSCDNETVGRIAADHFLEQHFEHFAVVPETSGINWSRQRCDSFRHRLEEEGKTASLYPASKKDDSDWGLECRRMIRWLRRLPKPVAVFAPHDVRGRQVLDACLIAEIKVPHQVAVLGVDNDAMICDATTPPMSSVTIDTESGGYAAAEMLDGLMRGFDPTYREFLYRPKGIAARTSSESIPFDDPLVLKAREFIRINAGFSVRVSDVTRHLKMSKRSVELRFKKTLGYSVFEEIRRVRLETVQKLVAQTDTPFGRIASLCGFECVSHLGALFKSEFGMTMSEYRERHPE